jgi:hypothetical protein
MLIRALGHANPPWEGASAEEPCRSRSPFVDDFGGICILS